MKNLYGSIPRTSNVADVSMWDAVDKFLSFYSEDDEFLFNISQEDRLNIISVKLAAKSPLA